MSLIKLQTFDEVKLSLTIYTQYERVSIFIFIQMLWPIYRTLAGRLGVKFENVNKCIVE
jgi:hypothetical protein